MVAEIWADGQKIGEWSRPALPEVGDTIGLDMYGEVHEAEIDRIEEVPGEDGGTTTRLLIVFTGDP